MRPEHFRSVTNQSQFRWCPFYQFYSSRVRWSSFDYSCSGWLWDRFCCTLLDWILINGLLYGVRLKGFLPTNNNRPECRCLFVASVYTTSNCTSPETRGEFKLDLALLLEIVSLTDVVFVIVISKSSQPMQNISEPRSLYQLVATTKVTTTNFAPTSDCFRWTQTLFFHETQHQLTWRPFCLIRAGLRWAASVEDYRSVWSMRVHSLYVVVGLASVCLWPYQNENHLSCKVDSRQQTPSSFPIRAAARVTTAKNCRWSEPTPEASQRSSALRTTITQDSRPYESHKFKRSHDSLIHSQKPWTEHTRKRPVDPPSHLTTESCLLVKQRRWASILHLNLDPQSIWLRWAFTVLLQWVWQCCLRIYQNFRDNTDRNGVSLCLCWFAWKW